MANISGCLIWLLKLVYAVAGSGGGLRAAFSFGIGDDVGILFDGVLPALAVKLLRLDLLDGALVQTVHCDACRGKREGEIRRALPAKDNSSSCSNCHWFSNYIVS